MGITYSTQKTVDGLCKFIAMILMQLCVKLINFKLINL